MSEHIVKVTILGRKLSVKTDASPEQLAKTVEFIEKRAENLKKSSLATDPLVLSLFLNMILADELLDTKAKLESLEKSEDNEYAQVDKLATDLLDLISNEVE